MTLLKLEEQNKIEVIKIIGSHHKYNVQKYINDNKKKADEKISVNIKNTNNIKEKINIYYVRVSTKLQKSDLEHQKDYMKKNIQNMK